MPDKFTTAREIAELNIGHYRKLLQSVLDPQIRRTVMMLLDVELAKLKQFPKEKGE